MFKASSEGTELTAKVGITATVMCNMRRLLDSSKHDTVCVILEQMHGWVGEVLCNVS